MKDSQQIKVDDARLGIADPEESAAALSALTRMVNVTVATSDIRAILWSAGQLDYANLVLVSETRDFTTTPRMLVAAAITAVSLLNSDRKVLAEDDAAWTQVMEQLAAFAQYNIISQASVTGVWALRQTQELIYPIRIVADDVIAARALP